MYKFLPSSVKFFILNEVEWTIFYFKCSETVYNLQGLLISCFKSVSFLNQNCPKIEIDGETVKGGGGRVERDWVRC